MPKNPVTDSIPDPIPDPITDQEVAFARLILSGTMNDQEAAEAVGLNPAAAAHTKSRPRVRAYMVEHRAAVNEKLAGDEAEGPHQLNLSRDQILNRLWQLANLSPEQTRGTIAGQIKAMSMIVAIEGLIPDRLNARRPSAVQTQPAAPPGEANIYIGKPYRPQQHQTEDIKPGDAATAREAQPAASFVPEPNPTSKVSQAPASYPANPFIHPETLNWVPDATGFAPGRTNR